MDKNWDDLRIFLALARGGTLTTAAKALGVSHPTVSRRVQALEKQIGARLFDRLPDRFVPTGAGEELLADTEAMEKAAQSIHRRSAGLSDTVSGTVRVSAEEATAALLARYSAELRSKLRQIEFEVVSSHTLANLSRREADLLIREEVPELGGIVARKLGRLAYAVYEYYVANGTLCDANCNIRVDLLLFWPVLGIATYFAASATNQRSTIRKTLGVVALIILALLVAPLAYVALFGFPVDTPSAPTAQPKTK